MILFLFIKNTKRFNGIESTKWKDTFTYEISCDNKGEKSKKVV
jgi:hypothetical protein